MNHRKNYKKKDLPTAEKFRARTAENRRQQRESKREEEILRRRGLTIETHEENIETDSLRLKLNKWKEEKKKKIQQEKQAKRPPFKIGKIYHDDKGLYKTNISPPVKTEKSKALGYNSQKFKAPKGVIAMNIAQKTETRTLRSGSKNLTKQDNLLKDKVKSAINDFSNTLNAPGIKTVRGLNIQKTVGAKVTTLNVIIEESNHMNVLNEDPQHESSSILNSKNNSKKHTQSTDLKETVTSDSSKSSNDPDIDVLKSSHNLEQEQKCLKDPVVMKSPEKIHISKSEPDSESIKTSQYFRNILNEEVTNLEKLCVQWTELQQNELPSAINDQIDVAVGYARLLISQKLKQFSNLITEHEEGKNALKVLVSDLESFWEMVYIQVKNIIAKFEVLEEMKINNWQDPPSKVAKNKVKRKSPVKKTVPAQNRTRQNLRLFLANARKNVQKENTSYEDSSLSQIAPMSPAVMRVSFLAKQVASPKSQSTDLPKLTSTGKKNRKILGPVNTPSSEIIFTPRRSTRLQKISVKRENLDFSS